MYQNTSQLGELIIEGACGAGVDQNNGLQLVVDEGNKESKSVEEEIKRSVCHLRELDTMDLDEKKVNKVN